MQYPNVRRIKRPEYVFSEDGLDTHIDKLRGLLRHGPFRPAPVSDPNYVFVFQEEDREFANQLYVALKKGIASFPGSQQLVGLSIGVNQVESVRLPRRSFMPGSEGALSTLVDEGVASLGRKPDFAFIIGDHDWKYRRPSPYGAIKGALFKNKIPSQMVTRQLLQVESQFRFAMANIAMNTLAKLGGVPWLVRRVQEYPALVVGIGTTPVRDPMGRTIKRILGFAICMLSTGLFLDLSFFGIATSYEAYLPKLTKGLAATLDRLERSQTSISRLSLHVSQFERHETVEAISDLLRQRQADRPTPTPFELLRLNHDSPFMVMDLDNPGYVSEEGTVIDLASRHSIIVMEGRHEKAPWRGRKPVTMEVHREFASLPTPPFTDSLRDLFHLGFVNWRGFGTKTKPATLAYAKLLSEWVADVSAATPSIMDLVGDDTPSGSGLWFL